jgi:hypothetical protein
MRGVPARRRRPAARRTGAPRAPRGGRSARVRCAAVYRLDAEPQGILALLDWRAWTVTLSPVAAALLLIAWIGVGGASTQANRSAATETFTTWTEATATGDSPAVFLQPVSGDGLVEAVLTGAATAGGDTDAR